MVAFLPAPMAKHDPRPFRRPMSSMGLNGRGSLQCLGRAGQLNVPSSICSRPAGASASSLSMSLMDPGLIAASAAVGAVLWLLVESYESCPVGHVPEKVMACIQVSLFVVSPVEHVAA